MYSASERSPVGVGTAMNGLVFTVAAAVALSCGARVRAAAIAVLDRTAAVSGSAYAVIHEVYGDSDSFTDEGLDNASGVATAHVDYFDEDSGSTVWADALGGADAETLIGLDSLQCSVSSDAYAAVDLGMSMLMAEASGASIATASVEFSSEGTVGSFDVSVDWTFESATYVAEVWIRDLRPEQNIWYRHAQTSDSIGQDIVALQHGVPYRLVASSTSAMNEGGDLGIGGEASILLQGVTVAAVIPLAPAWLLASALALGGLALRRGVKRLMEGN